MKPEVSALGSSTLSGVLLSSRPPEHGDPIGMFSTNHCKAVCKACPQPTHFLRTKCREDEVLRGSVEPFRVLIQSGPFGFSTEQFRSNFRVMNPSVDLFGRATTWRCQYDVNFVVWGRSPHWILLLGVRMTLQNLLSMRLGVPRVISTCCFLCSK